MCGIAGIIGKGSFLIEDLERMSDVIKHRGPDDEGFLLVTKNFQVSHYKGNLTIDRLRSYPHIREAVGKDNLLIGLAHKRLSIIDLSEAGHQPMSYANDKLFIVFNGEIYNYIEIRTELSESGFEFKSDSDTEVILAAYLKWGEECVNRFVGMWAFVICDIIHSKIFISRDRFGIKPFYYKNTGDRFFFSSEIKALLSVPEIEAEVNYHSLYQYINFRQIASNEETLLKDIKELASGCNLTIDLISFHVLKHQYYNIDRILPSLSANVLVSENNFIEALRKLLFDSVKLHLRSDVPVGSCLSGGLDSSALVAYCMKTDSSLKFKTFTAAYIDKGIDESGYALELKKNYPLLDQKLTFPDENKLIDEFDKMIWFQDLPFMSTSIFAQWEVMKLANEHKIKVLLDGQGADELLAGYDILAGVYLYSLLKKFSVGQFLNEYQLLHKNRFLHSAYQLASAAFFDMPEFLKFFFRKKTRLGYNFISKEFHHQFAYENSPSIGQKDLRKACIASLQYSLKDLLRYEDRNSMAFSIESRVPYLDHRLSEFLLGLPDRMKINNGWSKYILRKAIEPDLPTNIVWRKDKKGFITPQETWRVNSAEYIKSFLNSIEIPSFFNKKNIIDNIQVEKLTKVQSSELWNLVTILKWKEIFKVKF